jgi:hypothetical protein
MTLTMYDSVNANSIPAGALYAAYYVDGAYANYQAIRNRCPHAHLFSITVRGGAADCCDSETGDLSVAQTETWIADRLAGGHYRPCAYANLDRWTNGGLLAGLSKYGSRIRRWVAAYNDRADIPPGYDGHQFSTGNVDTSVLLDNFFQGAPSNKPTGTAGFGGSVDVDTGHWAIHGSAGTFHGAPPSKWWSAEIQLNTDTGAWRIHGMPANAPPLGG